MSDGQTPMQESQEIDPRNYPTAAQLDAEFTKNMQQLGVLDFEERTLWARQAQIGERLETIRAEKLKIDELVGKLDATKQLVMSEEFQAELAAAVDWAVEHAESQESPAEEKSDVESE